MGSFNFCIPSMLFLFQLAVFTLGEPSSVETPCNEEDKYRQFLGLAMDFIEKVRKDIISADKVSCKREVADATNLGLDMEIIERVKENVLRGKSDICKVKPSDCADIMKFCGFLKSGVYTIWPKIKINEEELKVYCDMDTDGGGWTVLQRRGNYGKPVDYFYKYWESYKRGFGNISEDFWLGNDRIYVLSNQKNNSIRFDLQDVENQTRYALYKTFRIENEAEMFRLHISGYSGDAGDGVSPDNGSKFSTKERNNRGSGTNCVEQFKSAWWHGPCHYANINGLYLYGKHESHANGVNWYYWKGYKESLANTEMKIRPVDFIT